MKDVSAPAKTRRPQAERSETMRRRLLDAAISVLKDRGLAQFRTADVVDMAGVSKGALLHHFPTKTDLIAAAFEWLREGTDQSEHHFRDRETLAEVISDMVAESRSFFSGEAFSVTLDITVSSARTPELRDSIFESVRGLRQRTVARWTERLCSYGIDEKRAANAILLVNAAFRGSAVRAVWDADRSLVDHVDETVTEMVADYLAKPASTASR